ncbi:hypothetical protein PG993_014163 [Apiospora rasikravindrae]|uniref:Uncharacterized protein n=1 Tax=Apiospora rasikravindrae TaxID=990691 RepID=A0ABR1RSH7_9PEZI
MESMHRLSTLARGLILLLRDENMIRAEQRGASKWLLDAEHPRNFAATNFVPIALPRAQNPLALPAQLRF